MPQTKLTEWSGRCRNNTHEKLPAGIGGIPDFSLMIFPKNTQFWENAIFLHKANDQSSKSF
jgi:hypothetical protein